MGGVYKAIAFVIVPLMIAALVIQGHRTERQLTGLQDTNDKMTAKYDTLVSKVASLTENQESLFEHDELQLRTMFIIRDAMDAKDQNIEALKQAMMLVNSKNGRLALKRAGIKPGVGGSP